MSDNDDQSRSDNIFYMKKLHERACAALGLDEDANSWFDIVDKIEAKPAIESGYWRGLCEQQTDQTKAWIRQFTYVRQHVKVMGWVALVGWLAFIITLVVK